MYKFCVCVFVECCFIYRCSAHTHTSFKCNPFLLCCAQNLSFEKLEIRSNLIQSHNNNTKNRQAILIPMSKTLRCWYSSWFIYGITRFSWWFCEREKKNDSAMRLYFIMWINVLVFGVIKCLPFWLTYNLQISIFLCRHVRDLERVSIVWFLMCFNVSIYVYIRRIHSAHVLHVVRRQKKRWL